MLRRLARGMNLRAKVLGILAGGLVFVMIAVGVLVLVARQSDHLLERASTAQRHLELLLLLSGRISDYGLVVLEAVQQPRFGAQKLNAGKARVDDLFRSIDRIISEQIGLFPAGDAQSAVATKSLLNARMKARFSTLHRQVNDSPDVAGEPGARADHVRSAMNAFGVHFAPQLAQAVEDQRKEARDARSSMSELRRRATVFAIVWALAAMLGSGLLYWFAGRPILSRISQTVEGATEISSGELERRLKPEGHDELTLLMMKFNRMADSFSRRESKLLAMQMDLQDTISKRTSDLSAANERLEDIDTNRRRFFSDVSHELRTPLTVIIGEAEISLRNPKGIDEPGKNSLETILARAKSLKRRVDDLLRVARSESGKLDLDLEEWDLNKVIEDAVEDTRQLASNHQVLVSFESSPDPMTIQCDREWLRQAVSGLVVNAVKYSPSDSEISIYLSAGGETAEITVADQGFGIPKDEITKVFDRFYKGGTADASSGGGFGIGLSLIKWVVEAHSGVITAVSPTLPDHEIEQGGKTGTTFSIKLPLLTS